MGLEITEPGMGALTLDPSLLGFGYAKTELLTPAQMDKAIGKKKAAELLAGFISRAPGAPTIATETDKRPAYNRADDFDTLD
jgi:hypothetical protein